MHTRYLIAHSIEMKFQIIIFWNKERRIDPNSAFDKFIDHNREMPEKGAKKSDADGSHDQPAPICNNIKLSLSFVHLHTNGQVFETLFFPFAVFRVCADCVPTFGLCYGCIKTHPDTRVLELEMRSSFLICSASKEESQIEPLSPCCV